jgi:hypothetical protein
VALPRNASWRLAMLGVPTFAADKAKKNSNLILLANFRCFGFYIKQVDEKYRW